MSSNDFRSEVRACGLPATGPEIILAELVPEHASQRPGPLRRRRVALPALLFVATGLSTLFAQTWFVETEDGLRAGLTHGLLYAGAVMTILICHEAGHFLQARRYGVYASFPYFLPMPFSPLGTLGAVIAMEARKGDRRALFDIGITGPLAGLLPTMFFLVLGLYLSRPIAGRGQLGDPLLIQLLVRWMFGPLPPGHDILLHPIGFAGWVGLLVTAINLAPISQLDGGHILYGLLRRKANLIAPVLLVAAAVAVFRSGLWFWTPMLALLMLMGPHPPTADDDVPLGVTRTVLGWLTLAFIPIGFTPTPFLF